MPTSETEADILLRDNGAAAARLASELVVPLNDNFVERPWGGFRLARAEARAARMEPIRERRIGECFEIAADDRDAEARRYPSRIRLRDGSVATLPALLDAHAETLLGARFVARHGQHWPLLPKTLDVVELLSVQAHPPGNTEVYVILAAEPGATLRLGFKTDVDAKSFGECVADGRRDQQRLKELCGAVLERRGAAERAQAVARRSRRDPGRARAALATASSTRRWRDVANVLRSLHAAYWDVLDLMNEIPVAPGQVIYNATPERIASARRHTALRRNPRARQHQALEIVALEIRKPGTTYRAWDNVRFPLRDVDAGAAIAALNLRVDTPRRSSSWHAPRARTARRGCLRRLGRVPARAPHADRDRVNRVAAAEPHNLHALAGAVSVYASDGALVGRLASGDSALVPIGVGAYRVVADTEPAEVLKVSVPDVA